MTQLLEATWAVLNRAMEIYQDNPRATSWLRLHADRLAGPLRVALAGQQRAGRSTLVNALVGEQVAPLGLAEDVPAMVWYGAGATPRVSVFPAGEPPVELAAERLGGQLRADLGPWRERAVDRIVVDWPARSLKGMVLIDVGGPSTADWLADADAVLYVAQQVHAADIRMLQSLHEHPIAATGPVGVLLVLSRADEVGAGQIDALFAARQLARQHRRDERLRACCQDVIAVTGLLGHAGRTLLQREFDVLAALASGPRAEVDGHLLSADRFVGATLPVDAELRQALLDRLGLFGLRLATALIRQGYDTHAALCAQLVARSGLTDLRTAIARFLTDRMDVLKARSALIGLEVVLRMEPRPAAVAMVAELERILAGAHDFRELRMIAELHAGRPVLPEELREEARVLVGGDGVSVAARLGLADEPGEPALGPAVVEALRRWRSYAENPVFDEDARAAAATVVRSCEGMLASLPQ
jgi:hypothetical protein